MMRRAQPLPPKRDMWSVAPPISSSTAALVSSIACSRSSKPSASSRRRSRTMRVCYFGSALASGRRLRPLLCAFALLNGVAADADPVDLHHDAESLPLRIGVQLALHRAPHHLLTHVTRPIEGRVAVESHDWDASVFFR